MIKNEYILVSHFTTFLFLSWLIPGKKQTELNKRHSSDTLCKPLLPFAHAGAICCHSIKSNSPLTFLPPGFCNTSFLSSLVWISAWGESFPLYVFAAGLLTPGELLLSHAGLLASWRVSRLAVLGVREPLWPTLRASKSIVLLSNASWTLQNKPPYFCRGTWSAVPGRAR